MFRMYRNYDNLKILVRIIKDNPTKDNKYYIPIFYIFVKQLLRTKTLSTNILITKKYYSFEF